MYPSLLHERVVEAELAERRRQVAALQRGLLAARARKQSRRENHQAVSAPAAKVPVPTPCAEC